MLVLSRKARQKINIGHDIELVIVKIRNDRVEIGIKADRSVHVRRGELPPREPEQTS